MAKRRDIRTIIDGVNRGKYRASRLPAAPTPPPAAPSLGPIDVTVVLHSGGGWVYPYEARMEWAEQRRLGIKLPPGIAFYGSSQDAAVRKLKAWVLEHYGKACGRARIDRRGY